jgi:hypothetical protein
VLITGVSATATQENMLVESTAASGVTITIAPGVVKVTIKDKSGSVNPVIGVTSVGSTLEDPNNLGVTADYSHTVFVRGQGACVAFWYDGVNYQVVSTAS